LACAQPAQLGEVGHPRMRPHRPVRPGDGGGAAIALHVFGQGQDHRPGPPGCRDLERLIDQLGDALGQVDLGHPFGQRREHPAEIDLLKRLAVDLVAGDLADQHDHRRRILKCGVDADRGVAGAGAPGHQQHAGSAGELAVSLGHERGAPFLAAGHQTDFRRIVERVEHFEKALAGDAEGHVDTMRAQRRDNQLTAAQWNTICRRHPT
jgi:hypothetical protein